MKHLIITTLIVALQPVALAWANLHGPTETDGLVTCAASCCPPDACPCTTDSCCGENRPTPAPIAPGPEQVRVLDLFTPAKPLPIVEADDAEDPHGLRSSAYHAARPELLNRRLSVLCQWLT